MHVISRRKLREFWAEHPDAEGPLSDWYKSAKRATWENFSAVRAVYGSADRVKKFVVFNIGGNKYRLIVDMLFDEQVILVRHVLTHKDYDRGLWKTPPAT